MGVGQREHGLRGMSGPGTIAVVGAGPGVGAAVARRFGREGFAVGLVARNADRLAELSADLDGEGIRTAIAVADARDAAALSDALRALADELGPIDVLCFCPLPDVGLIKPVTDTSAAELAAALELNVVGAAAATSAVLAPMREHGRGTLLFTTGSAALSPSPERAVSGVVYGAQTVYVNMLHEALGAEGIHVAQTVIRGAIGPGLRHEPATVADHLWQRHVARDDVLTTIE
jgi:short-subunit dehydrogenase